MCLRGESVLSNHLIGAHLVVFSKHHGYCSSSKSDESAPEMSSGLDVVAAHGSGCNGKAFCLDYSMFCRNVTSDESC